MQFVVVLHDRSLLQILQTCSKNWSSYVGLSQSIKGRRAQHAESGSLALISGEYMHRRSTERPQEDMEFNGYNVLISHPLLEGAHRVAACAEQSYSMCVTIREPHTAHTSVISNLTRPTASPSAMAR